MRLEAHGLDEVTLKLTRILDGVSEAGRENIAANVAAIVMASAEEVWPSTSHPENIYATDDSVRQWQVTSSGPGSKAVVNFADHAIYADRGDTRYGGPGSAKPYKARGARLYRRQILDHAWPQIEIFLDAWLGAQVRS